MYAGENREPNRATAPTPAAPNPAAHARAHSNESASTSDFAANGTPFTPTVPVTTDTRAALLQALGLADQAEIAETQCLSARDDLDRARLLPNHMQNEDIRDLEAALKSKEADLAEVHKLVGKRVAHLLEDPEALAAARASGHVQSALKCEAVHDIQSNFSMRDQRSMLDVHGISKRQWDALFGALQSAVNKTEWGKRRTNILVSSEVLAALKQIMDADFVEVYKPQPLSDGKGWRIDARRAMQTLIVNNQLRQSEYDTVTCIWQADGAPWGSNWDAIFMRFKDASKSLGPNARYGCGLHDSALHGTVCAYIGKENREVSYICMIQVF